MSAEQSAPTEDMVLYRITITQAVRASDSVEYYCIEREGEPGLLAGLGLIEAAKLDHIDYAMGTGDYARE